MTRMDFVMSCRLCQEKVIFWFLSKWCCLGILPRVVRDGCRLSVLSLLLFANLVISRLYLLPSRQQIWAGVRKFCQPVSESFPPWLSRGWGQCQLLVVWRALSKDKAHKRRTRHGDTMPKEGGRFRAGGPTEFGQQSDPQSTIKAISLSDAVFWAIWKSDRTQGTSQLWTGCYSPNTTQLNSRKLYNYRTAETHAG